MLDDVKELRWIRILLTIIAIPVFVIILKSLRSIFIPLILAVFLNFMFAPLISFLQKKKVHILFIMLIMILIIVLFFSLITILISAATNNLVSGFPRYQLRFSTLIADVSLWLEGLAKTMDIAISRVPGLDPNQLFSLSSFSISKTLTGIMSTTFGIGWNIFLIIIFLMFMVAESGQLEKRLRRVMVPAVLENTMSSLYRIQRQLQKYLLTKSLISFATAVVGMILMILYGVDFVLICGILLFVLNFIPNVGSIVASGIPMIVCLLQSGLDFRTISFSILIVGTQMLFGNVIEPKVQGDNLNLSPIMVLVALIFWSWVWGIVGMILAVPITSGINIILKQLDPQNLVSAVISGTEKKK
ncbi:MAG TPA: AI-2E family transporter [Candidatus Cloacimonadota bacterium]|nr:AI-2E family transporter [Candidatus Cloacimonadota bacterium]